MTTQALSDPYPLVKCLLVDDLQDNLLALSALLKQDRLEILTARSAAEALELLLVHDVALAILDVQMPDIDGIELAELMRGSERTRNVPIIFVTAGVRDTHRLFKGYENGAVDFLYKPIEPHVLRSKAEVFFQLHRQKLMLACQLAQLKETLRLNEMFVAVLSHDLRSPLSTVMAASDMLSFSSDSTVREIATQLETSGKRMNRMIEDVLDYARARLAGGIPLKREDTNLGDVIHRVVQEHRVCHSDRSIEVRQQGNLDGHWDASRLTQLASNLIGNALQHGEQNGCVELELNGLRSGFVSLEIRNPGTIPEEAKPHVFDPFRTNGQYQGRGGGLGLGLYIVQQIAKAHEGEVYVNSANGYTTFRLEIPR